MTTTNKQEPLGGDLHRAIMNLPCDHRQSDEYKRGHRDARHAAAELVAAAEASQQEGAAGAGDLANEIQAELASETLNIGIQQSLLRRAAAKIADFRAQLARLQAPAGESIDTPEFRELLHGYRKNPNYDTTRELSALIAHIDAQLARQRQAQVVAWRVTGNYTDQPFKDESSADAYLRGLLTTDPDGGYVKSPLYATPPVQGEPVAMVEAGKFANRLQWVSDEAMEQTPVGSKLYTRAAPQAEEVLDAALAFADDAIDHAFEGGDLDGGTVQEMAEARGLLKRETMTEPCGGACNCLEAGAQFPTECFRKTYRLKRTTAADNQKGGAA